MYSCLLTLIFVVSELLCLLFYPLYLLMAFIDCIGRNEYDEIIRLYRQYSCLTREDVCSRGVCDIRTLTLPKCMYKLVLQSAGFG